MCLSNICYSSESSPYMYVLYTIYINAAPHRPSTESSKAAGSAAIARLESQEQRGGGTKSSGSKTRPTSEGIPPLSSSFHMCMLRSVTKNLVWGKIGPDGQKLAA